MATKVVIVDALDPAQNRSVIGDAIRFTLPGGQNIEVMIRQDDPDSLDIRSTDGKLVITPWAANAIRIQSSRL